ncbi:hypothetical protein [Ralstonia mannitolilytica]|uniref:hypothetical protein n=1 Tax=Ralstonia mannitolilytica TaxID=105219 RepID=UPI000CEF05DE|nr:hypothetical protein [Ralstonia mannitolilytica]
MLENPFKGKRYGDIQTYTVTAEDRIRMVKTFNRKQCEAALLVQNLQKTVERAVRARLRQLAEEERKA